MNRFLVLGGAGYVGSHLVAALTDQGQAITVVDDLSQGHIGSLPGGVEFVHMDLARVESFRTLLAGREWEAVFHFAARSSVGESMQDPFLYLEQNAVVGFRLIEACVAQGVKRFVLSSTANLFGTPDRMPIDEQAAVDPGSPYGESKLMLERALHWADRIGGMRSACLRYFNAAGADMGARLGEDHEPETHLIPLAIDAALGRRPPLSIFGDDYPTPDGTCIRDYVHVSDIVSAHLAVLEPLRTRSVTYNIGTGTGCSVREVMDSVARVSGRSVPHHMAPRRPGDPAILVADSKRLTAETGWRPRFVELDEIVETAWRWRLAHPHGYGDRTRPRPCAEPETAST